MSAMHGRWADTGSDAAVEPGGLAAVGSTTSGPTVLRIALGAQLRRLREEAGVSREVAGDAIRASTAKISRLELGRVGFKERDVADLLTLYGVHRPAERGEFLALAGRANSPGWWHRYADLLPSWFETFLGLEQAASVIRTYELQFVPGIVQSRGYARAVTSLGYTDPEEVERRTDLRMRRQEILAGGGPTLWAVVDEAALRRNIGGPELMRGQLDHLIEMNRLPNVSLQIAPLRYGGHAAAGGPFTILRFDEPDLPDIVYLEQLTSALYLDKRADVEHYAMVMDRLCAQVDPPERTESMLRAIRGQL
jgi:transcriptional regulator with XRE-family HTH domain